jgi:uncharacterized protein
MTTLKIVVSAVIVIVSLALFRAWCHHDEMEKLASMIRNGDAAGVSQLIASHPNLVNANFDSRTRVKPLDLAANHGQETICSNLIAAGADVNSQDEVFETPLFFAFGTPNSNVLAMLLQHGASATHTNIKGDTPLYYAVITDNTDAVAMLLKYGADPTLKNKAGKTPLDYAKESTNEDVVKIMSEAISKATNR